MARPRWLLHIQAQIWRTLMAIGMFLHKVAPPRPPQPSFERTIPTNLSPHKGAMSIKFYVPRNYRYRKELGGKRFPVVINFHGGGFTLGTATDDARWAGTVVEQVGAIVASVDYRLAPEFHFPTAIEDGVDACLYISKHAGDLYIDPDRIAISGFSAGGNMAFTVPLRLQEELSSDLDDDVDEANNIISQQQNKSSYLSSPQTHSMKISTSTDGAAATTTTTIARPVRDMRIAAIISWYPSTDYTQTRTQRRHTNPRKDQELSAVFTELFDESYLQPPSMDLSNPYLSPGLAPKQMLEALPDDIILYTCEWDMLRSEGERFKERLEGLGKRVAYQCVPGVPHGWDKAPNPITPAPSARRHYLAACKELRRILKYPE